MPPILLYARTLRFLKWRQIAFRAIRRLQRAVPPQQLPPAPVRHDRLQQIADVLSELGPSDAEERVRNADAILAGSFTFLNDQQHIPQIDWRHRYQSHLWNYNLHYFGYALDLAWAARLSGEARYVTRFLELAKSWVQQTRNGGGDGWEPYALSVRIPNWTYAIALLGETVPAADRELLLASLYSQLVFLSKRLEYHILANHVQKNFFALTIGGLLFDGSGKRSLLQRGATGLWQELESQVLLDGGHFERSPMYHALALSDFLEAALLLRACDEGVPDFVSSKLKRMACAFGVLCRPNGKLHLFNDTADGIAPSLARLDHLARLVTSEGMAFVSGPLMLKETGYFGYHDTNTNERILIDCGIPGPAFQPGHAHCDALSFELDLAGVPVIVDSGVSGYDGDPLREYVRSTRAHNTVIINNREQSEVWGTFRLGRRISGITCSQVSEADTYEFSGSYHPFHDRSLTHKRTIRRETDAWVVVDSVQGANRSAVVSFLHFHPEFEIEMADDTVVATSKLLRVTVSGFGVDRIEVVRGALNPVQGWHCPEFGRREPCSTVVFTSRRSFASFGFRIGHVSLINTTS